MSRSAALFAADSRGYEPGHPLQVGADVIGIVNVNVEPVPTWLVTQILPP